MQVPGTGGCRRRAGAGAGLVPWSRGSWVTASLWIVALAAHLGYDALVAGHRTDGVGGATIVLYLAVSLGIQRLVVHQRAQRLRARPMARAATG